MSAFLPARVVDVKIKSMRILKSTTFTWYELGALKWAVFLMGIAFGAHWPEVFAKYAFQLLAAGLILSLYVGLAWWKQR